ncbi:MAG: cytochrome c3 family protein, partial [Ignavibacteriae bacterium]|nr:cytochrome c3 family protein [Ignavibacteriota bacterium]
IENLKTHTQMNLDCKKCHICDTPTKANPCLILCPRNKLKVVRHLPEEGPENLTIDKISSDEDLYGPVNFTHKLHSEMSLMSGGCSICHHFNPPGKIVKCSHCHETARDRKDKTKPDLKAAFHRQCMDCHKSWEEKTECESCHSLNSKKIESTVKIKAEKVHPEVKIPQRVIYETDYDEGSVVTYFHNDHSSLFNLECSDCHDQESCANCHAEIRLESIKADPHERCSTCHDTENNCNKCHKSEIARPFDHKIKTGFDIATYHSDLSCAECHKTQNKFSGLKPDCVVCHSTSDGYFNHSITGIKLDETHVEFYCENCHQDKDYSRKPICNECHDDDISFPTSIPGERIK